MSELENFITRWDRLKRLAELKRRREADPRGDATPSSTAARDVAIEDAGAELQEGAAAAFDPANLPTIDSITGSTDIRAFLQPSVPADLTRAALRRVWVSDPVIRNFIGIAENQWDFTDPAAILGFGPLQDTGNAVNLVARAIARLDESLDSSAARSPDDREVAEKLPTVGDDSERNGNDDKTNETQPPSITQTDRETTDPTSANNQLEPARQPDRPRAGMRPRNARRAHGGAMPR
ncbi:MAG TPA: DUF3306 domain-containing protein [Bradyrhizobium sp.]|nr:DUF3306 domain-containing protein [Bradyrhizobium sp.]